jgi:hypothetical protein
MFSVDLPPDSSWKWETETYGDGHGKPCYYCGKLCNSVAGSPGQWPMGFPEKDEPGKVKYHHMGCLLKRLNMLEEARNIIETYVGFNFTKISGPAISWLKEYDKINKKEG